MRPLIPITLFSSYVSALVLQPLITPAPRIAVRDVAQSICGYYSLFGLTETISCDYGTPCLVATNLSPAAGYCSGDDSGPITSVYPWGQWPSNQGCGYGSECCPVLTPAVAKYSFNGGATVILGCDTTSGAYSAFVGTPAPYAVSASAVPTSTTHGATPNSNSGLATNPVLDSTASPTAALPSQTASSSSGLSGTTTIVVIVVGAAVALISGVVFLVFLYLLWRRYHNAKLLEQQQPFLNPSYQSSNPSLNSKPADKKDALKRWALIATIISPIFAIVGLVVAIYFGLKQK